jgi:alkanesulfonate monooxygenase SsuD/methylene tetrahydromethanopterin reductase-like flavin-dependent oxidoreductase (luciferase family)
MTLCDTDRGRALDIATESFEWYPKAGARQIASVAEWMAERQQDLGNYGYAGELRTIDETGLLDQLSLDYLVASGAAVCGTPADCVDAIGRYQEAGVDTLLCLVNPYRIPHDAVMRTIELLGTEVLPHFRD